MLVCFDQLASRIVNANYSGVRATEKVRVVNGVSYGIFAAQQRAPKWKRIRERLDDLYGTSLDIRESKP